jgi:hypothetical protein
VLSFCRLEQPCFNHCIKSLWQTDRSRRQLQGPTCASFPLAMFLDWIAQLHLLQHDARTVLKYINFHTDTFKPINLNAFSAETNILNVLPLSTRRTLISEITSYLHPAAGKAAPHPSIFSSPAHVKWFMEVIGQGFNLPLEDLAITTEDINIYAQWLFEANQRPVAVSREGLEQEFFQIIFHQYSLLFRPRIPRQHSGSGNKSSNFTTTSTLIPAPGAANLIAIPMAPPNPSPSARETVAQLIQRHIELCKKVLTVFTMAGRTLDLSEETWSVLLKVVLGITDSLLSERVSDGTRTGPSMGDELCEHLLRVGTSIVECGVQEIRSLMSDFSPLRFFSNCGYAQKPEMLRCGIL